MWAESPLANVGLLMGERSRLVGVDIDPYNGGEDSLKALIERHGPLPQTPEILTGRGRIPLFRHPGRRIKNATNVARIAGIDIRGDGGLVVAPPSLHKNGKRYRWNPEARLGEVPFAEMPEWLLGILTGTAETAPAAARFDTARALAGVPEGERNDTLFRLTSKLRGADVPRDVAERLVLEAAENCTPPLPAEEARKIVEAAYDRYKPTKASPPATQPPKNLATQPKVEIYAATELMKRKFKAPTMIVEDLLPIGLTVLVGRPKVGKSWFALNLALAVASGTTALGCKSVEQGSVLYAALEDHPRRIKIRLRRILGKKGSVPGALHFAHRIPRMQDGFEDTVRGWLADHPGAKLLIVDTLARIRPPRPGRSDVYQADTDAGVILQQLALDHEIALLVLHHTRKGETEDPIDLVNGTTGIPGTADTVQVLKRIRTQLDADLFLTGRDLPEDVIALRFDDSPGQWKILKDPAVERISGARADVLNLIRKSANGIRPKQIEEKLKRPGGTIRRILSEMKADGIVEVERGRYALRGGQGENEEEIIEE